MFGRGMAVGATCAALMLTLAGTAAAHECYIANRSEKGNAGATHSANWTTQTVAGFVQSPGFPPGVDPDCFLAYWLGHGGPASFTVRTNKTIGSGSSNPNLGNGSGLEHIETAWGALFGEALGACAL
ncbi:hypothetical protein SAMN05192558_101216 [Actinokineospora alba]|uniref:Peptidase inhibitor family I36 n=1 Tax=Actinokineospora alba TaxID=504798 RepID=A0A1H0F3J3_9PSEU|nr:hypothetical protein [Actinokineospora alba]TDP69326.1 hypothetical protein C8E96_4912 [Actinokineospora alba]SDI19199.1 hypothetical protein SAMN05421871_103654 [Actinokineospora alba]SDN89228.1 hypothetical protein SAMN05192558_101216 [Actinokineospora alba]